jgi:ectoine hydroxylase-related dioxygenase (phytanoyl-CoA dioxygenase family)
MEVPVTQTLPQQARFAQIREVTAEEVDFFNENGWVKLDGLFDPELAGELLRHVQATISARQDGSDDYVNQRAPGTDSKLVAEYVASTNLRESDDLISSLATCRELGEAAARLLKTHPLRLFADAVFHKPAAQDDTFFSGATPWHQDYPAMPMDRANSVQIWVAAAEILPEMGSLQYLSGSHRLPPMGKAEAYELPDGSRPANGAVDIYPWLLEQYEVSPPFHLMPGDALAHHGLTMHYAMPNQSATSDRWAWASSRFDARVAYNGAPNHRTDGRGLVLNKQFDHPAFPLVG